jgi:hypothetical protein
MTAVLPNSWENSLEGSKMPAPDLNGGGHYYRLIITLKNEPQAEL